MESYSQKINLLQFKQNQHTLNTKYKSWRMLMAIKMNNQQETFVVGQRNL